MADYVGQTCRGGGQQLAPESPTESAWTHECVCVRMSVSCPAATEWRWPPPVHPSQAFYGKPALRFPRVPLTPTLHLLRQPQPDVFVSTKDKAGGSFGGATN